MKSDVMDTGPPSWATSVPLTARPLSAAVSVSSVTVRPPYPTGSPTPPAMRAALPVALLVALAACQDAPPEPAPAAPPVGAESVPVRPTAAQIQREANMPTEATDETEPAAPEVVARGPFSGAGRYDVSGEALLYRLDDGSHVVRLEGLESDNGPDLEVWLVRRTSGDVGRGGLALGALKSTRGSHNYAVPAGTDVSAFAGVSVWCERFSVNFGTAPLG